MKLKFKANLIMTILFIGYFAIVIIVTKQGSSAGIYIGIPLSLAHSLVCFFNKKVRTAWSIWMGIISFLTFCAYTYAVIATS